jgi:hypothetical protein
LEKPRCARLKPSHRLGALRCHDVGHVDNGIDALKRAAQTRAADKINADAARKDRAVVTLGCQRLEHESADRPGPAGYRYMHGDPPLLLPLT